MMEILYHYRSPIGTLALLASDTGLRRVMIDIEPDTSNKFFSNAHRLSEPLEHQVMKQVVDALDDYFQGQLRRFDLPLDLTGLSPFTEFILQTLQQVPFGDTRSYGELAASAGRPGSARAVGRVMSKNPLPLIIPCHRVISSSGHLGGYSGGRGTETKSWLLAFERNTLDVSG